jgi:hypothetical protein
MPFLSIFTSAKPFNRNPHVDLIQRNAVQSWRHLNPEVDVYMVGKEAGLAEAAQELGVQHISDVECNELGTPYIDSMFDLVRQRSSAPYLCYTNADIIFLPDFLESAHQIASQVKDFLVLSRRWDVDIDQPVVYDPGWDQVLSNLVKQKGILHGPVGSDFFLYPRHLLTDMLQFSIGRSGWDNWTIYHGLKSGWDVIDITRSATIIHQNHDYSHLPGGKPPYKLPETKKNVVLGGGMKNMYTILEATKILIDGQIKPAPWKLPRVLHWLELQMTSDDLHGIRKTVIRWLKRSRRRYEHELY